MIFCFDNILASLKSGEKSTNASMINLLNLINTSEFMFLPDALEFESFLNKTLHIIYTWLCFDEWNNVKDDKAARNFFEAKLKEKLLNETLLKNIFTCSNIVFKFSEHIKKDELKCKLVGLSYCFNLVALLNSEMNVLVSALDDQNEKNALEFFGDILKAILKFNYNVYIDNYFIIRNHLINCDTIIFEKILNTIEPLQQIQLDALLSVKKDLVDTKLIYLLLKKLNNIIDLSLKKETTHLFWYMFDEYQSITEKINLVYDIYTRKEILIDSEDGSVICLVDENFKSELTLTINQLSAENYEDSQVLLLYRVFCENNFLTYFLKKDPE